MPQVAANGDAITAFMAEAILARVVDNINAGQHMNHDHIFSPSEWWLDSGRDVRHTMHTDMSATGCMGMNGGEVTLVLTYRVDTM